MGGIERSASLIVPKNEPSVRPASRGPSWEQLVGLAIVLGLHAVALYGLWSYRLLPTPGEAATLFVNFIAPPPQPKPPEPPRPEPPKQVKLEKLRPVVRPQPRQLVAEAPVVSPAEPVAPPPPPAPEPVVEAPPAPPAKPAGPVTLGEELAVSCPERLAPVYPSPSRRLGEQGKVVLRVELDERGQVSTTRVATSSGSQRLDEAALGAVRQWRCKPAHRNGIAVRAVALQPFHFVLEGQ
jgi:protein TonB